MLSISSIVYACSPVKLAVVLLEDAGGFQIEWFFGYHTSPVLNANLASGRRSRFTFTPTQRLRAPSRHDIDDSVQVGSENPPMPRTGM